VLGYNILLMVFSHVCSDDEYFKRQFTLNPCTSRT